MLVVQRRYNVQRVPDAIEKIRVAKRDVPRTRGHLAANIFKHYLRLHHTKSSAIDRRHRAVSAQVLAAAARLRIADHTRPAARMLKMRVTCEQWETAAYWDEKLQPRKRDYWFTLRFLRPRNNVW